MYRQLLTVRHHTAGNHDDLYADITETVAGRGYGTVDFTICNKGTASAYVCATVGETAGDEIPPGYPAIEIRDMQWPPSGTEGLWLYTPAGADVYVTPRVCGRP